MVNLCLHKVSLSRFYPLIPGTLYSLSQRRTLHAHITMVQPHQSASILDGSKINTLQIEKDDVANKSEFDSPKTQVLKVGQHRFGQFLEQSDCEPRLREWVVVDDGSETMQRVAIAAKAIRDGDYPVAFPTETVYGLGANATDSRAVQGIYRAKGRPSDNPLIVHICDLDMYSDMMDILPVTDSESPYVLRYLTLVERFWPGPLTLLFKKPFDYLAPEVTAGLDTVGIRMPDSALARTLIKLAGVPVAAPSANSSTRPSPTTADHVFHDLDGKIQYIVDGGHCNVGVESTVIDGLRDPPLILRPGGVGIDEIRQCPGWEDIQKGYRDESEIGVSAPRAPGMKYKHYSPNATVILCEDRLTPTPQLTPGLRYIDPNAPLVISPTVDKNGPKPLNGSIIKVGIIRTKHWKRWLDWDSGSVTGVRIMEASVDTSVPDDVEIQDDTRIVPSTANGTSTPGFAVVKYHTANLHHQDGPDSFSLQLVDASVGCDTRTIASALFGALREMDERKVDVIFVEGIEDEESIAAAVMNRLRKAATERWGQDEKGVKKYVGSAGWGRSKLH